MIFLDNEDLAILSELERNCKQSLRIISKKTGISSSTIHFKTKRFEDSGIIRRYSAILDSALMGKPTTAFIFVTLRSTATSGNKLDFRLITKKIAENPLVIEAFTISGEFDIMIKIKAANLQEIGNYILDNLRQVEGVDKTITFDAMEIVKENGVMVLS